MPVPEQCHGSLPGWHTLQRGTWLEPALLLLDKLQQIRGAEPAPAGTSARAAGRALTQLPVLPREQVQGRGAGDSPAVRGVRSHRAALVPGPPGQEDGSVLGTAVAGPEHAGGISCTWRALAQ